MSQKDFERAIAAQSARTATLTGSVAPVAAGEGALSRMYNTNKDALIAASKLEVGNVVIETAVKQLAPRLPLPVQMFAGHPLFYVAVANGINQGIQQFAPTHPKAQIVADAVMVASMQKLVQSFNIPELISGILNGAALPDVLTN